MYDIDLLIAYCFMVLLFLRQVAILKKPNKINYAPLMLAMGALSTLIHFIIHPSSSNMIVLARESLFPFLVALMLYIVMNILNQTKESQNAKIHDAFTKVLADEINQLKKFILELEERMTLASKEDMSIQKDIREEFKNDIKTLDTIQANQMEFTKKFDRLQEWHEDIRKSFAYFSEEQMPDIDNVVHKHIDLLRISEQDHYNKLTQLIEKAVENKFDASEEIDALKASMESVKSISNDISQSIIEDTLSRFSDISKDFESQIISLKLHAEGIKTSLYEDENVLTNIRAQSEMIMKQMILSSKKMDELEKQNSNLSQVYSDINELVSEIGLIKSDYVKAQSQLASLSKELENSKNENLNDMKNKIDELSINLSSKIDESLERLYEHYHITNEKITQSVQTLTKKAQLQKGYTELDD